MLFTVRVHRLHVYALLSFGTTLACATAPKPTSADLQAEIGAVIDTAKAALHEEVLTLAPQCKDGNAAACTRYAYQRKRLDIFGGPAAAPNLTADDARQRACRLGVEHMCGSTDGASMGAVDVRPQQNFSATAPMVYPEAAKRLGVEGKVHVSARITADGRAEQASVARSTPIGFFEASALEFMGRAPFRPAQRAGQVAEAWVLQGLTFCLTGPDGETLVKVNRPHPDCERVRARVRVQRK